jgi:hypothetical protein
MQGIKISCKHKRSLYAFTKKSNGPEAKAHCIRYGIILRNLIIEAKKQHYRRLVAKSHKVKTTTT